MRLLRHFPCVPVQTRLIALGNHGGFSGARLWRVETSTEHFCLRAWPTAYPTPADLRCIHHLMQRASAAGLEFVPTIYPTDSHSTWLQTEDRLWELTRWLPGKADFHERPTPERLQAAATALARLHGVWAREKAGVGSCPAIERRLQTLQEWDALMRSGWRPNFASTAELIQPWAERAWQLLPPRLERLPELLAPWREHRAPLQPCLCDIWHDHVLFEDDTVTGIIDYGSVKLDHVAVDLARFLGSFVGDAPELRETALQAYKRVRPLAPDDRLLINVLDETGTLLGAANWLRWLYRDGKKYENELAVAGRLAALVQRIAERRL